MRKRARMPCKLLQPMLGKLLDILFLVNVGFALAQDSTFLVTKGPLSNDDGQMLGIFGIARGITERNVQPASRDVSHPCPPGNVVD